MAYNNIMDRSSDAGALIPEDVSREIIKNVPANSFVMEKARRLPDLPRNVRRLPVMSALPSGYFVAEAPAEGSIKQTSEAAWENVYLTAAEIAVILPIPESLLDDADYPIWSEVSPLIQEAFGVVFDGAVINGTNIPTDWSTALGGAGLIARCNTAGHVVSAASFADLYDAILSEGGAAGLVEADGFNVTGHIAALTMKAKLRGVRSTTGEPIFNTNPALASQMLLDGVPIAFPANGVIDPATALMISGDWSKLVYAIRKDLTFKVFTEGVITDASSPRQIQFNLMQDDMVALRAVMRIGVALPNPINRANGNKSTRCQFAVLTA